MLRLGTAAGRGTLAATVLGSGMALLDSTVVNVALPRIGEQFKADFAGLQWTINGYTLTLAAFILLGGSLGDHLGRRKIFLVGVAWFTVASLLCGIAGNIELLIGARLLQGIGGALLTPGSLAILQASFHPDDRAKAIGAWSGLGGIAAALGPLLGGWLVDAVSWRWAFLINLPLAAVVVLVTLRYVPESRDEGATTRLDIAGAVLSAVGLAGVTYALVGAGEPTTPAWLVAVTAVVGVAGLAAFLAVEARSTHPMMSLGLFRNRLFAVTNLLTLFAYAALSGVLFLLVIQLQVVSGYSALAAGLSMLPFTILMLAFSGRAGELATRIGPRVPMAAGLATAAVGVLLFTRIGPGASYVLDVLPGAILLGLGMTATVAPLTATVLGSVSDSQAGVASGVNNAVARTAGLLAVAALPLVVGLSGTEYRDPVAFDRAFTLAVYPCVGLLLAAAAVSWFGITPCKPRTPVARHQCPVGAPQLQPAREASTVA